jgi:hypothetical protein
MLWKLTGGLSVCMLVSSAALSASVVLSEATIPVEVLPLDPALARGELYGDKRRLNGWPSIGVQPARVARGVVRADAKGGDPFKRVLALALLNGSHRDAEALKPAWANVSSADTAWCTLLVDNSSYTSCYQDLDGDGRLESERDGYAMNDESLALIAVGPTRPMTPVGYRPAQTDELPLLHLGYLSCRPETQLATEVRRVVKGKSKESPFGGCRHVAQPIDGAPRLVQVDRFKVSLSEAEGVTRTEIVEGMSPGTILGSVRTERPLTDLTQVKSPAESREAAGGGQPYMYFTATPTVASGDVAPGDEIIGGGVAHGMVGRLQEPLQIFDSLITTQRPDVPTGTKLYGVPMMAKRGATRIEPNTVWCLPVLDEKRRTWDAECLTNTSMGSMLAMGLGTPFAVEATHASEVTRRTAFPRIERVYADIGMPLRLSLTLKKWSRDSVTLMLAVSPNDNTAAAPREQRFRRENDGSVLLGFGPGRLKLSPSTTIEGGAHVAIQQAPAERYSALPAGLRD